MMVAPGAMEWLRVEYLAWVDGDLKNVVQEQGEMVSVHYATTATA